MISYNARSWAVAVAVFVCVACDATAAAAPAATPHLDLVVQPASRRRKVEEKFTHTPPAFN